MLYRTDDPVADWDRHCHEQEKLAGRLPRCSECDQPITDDYGYYINDEWICEDCISRNYRKTIVLDY